jgi:hypothetical protein
MHLQILCDCNHEKQSPPPPKKKKKGKNKKENLNPFVFMRKRNPFFFLVVVCAPFLSTI